MAGLCEGGNEPPGSLKVIRKVGRPATKWLDDVEKDLKSIGVSRWKNEARDRTRWSTIIEAVWPKKAVVP
ncbi:hypothetical protein ANN_12475 [Periplaneta americana]|uniref:Uncharacterized protein n=1 Tax=Periplaneta americana TaxID=6978 RepID=A0ABQ8TIY4_PERAM|nr:hypothetical protein ANN_12475 [Periplaneta americana]